ncbi:hypothetical protein BBP40_009633 [Aspergillus hancockii]|nr:hypothetical protein BBP40_009633 [Aspergillus hancockii]
MSGSNYRINQRSNIGLVQEVHYGDNVFYNNSTKADLTLKHIALETHRKAKVEWEVSGTCNWLLQEGEFKAWKNMDAECSFLWLYGHPGCGKSTLMSRAIENIYQDSFTEICPGAFHLLYFYVGFGDDQGKDKLYWNMLMIFWEQAFDKPNERSIDTFGNHSPPEVIEDALHKLLISSRRDIYIVIDALDQFPSSSRDRLIEGLKAMVQKLKDEESGGRLRVAIGSRDCDDTSQLREHNVFQIEVTTESNKGDIETYLEKNLQSTLFRKKPELRNQVFHELNKQADGMFLWVSLQALDICNMEMESQITKALKSLLPPERMQDMYESYAKGVERLRKPTQQQITQRAMALLAHNTGSMPKDIILVALSLDSNGILDKGLHRELVGDPGKLTVFEFFKRYKTAIYNYKIARLCLSHLCSPEFSQGARSDATWYSPGSLGPILQEHPFLQFASSKWATSITKSFETEDQAGLVRSYSGVLNLPKIHFVWARQCRVECVMNTSSATSLSSDSDIFRERKWFDLAKLDDDGLTPIRWAIRNEVDLDDVSSTVRKPIEYGAGINEKDNEGRTPLYYAAHCRNPQATKLLVNKNVKLDLANNNDETALIAACRKHHE